MKCPIGTVRSRIFRARQLILEFMTQENLLND
jgi:DNA-directed RNA polymerase specialized sigma24 family protein